MIMREKKVLKDIDLLITMPIITVAVVVLSIIICLFTISNNAKKAKKTFSDTVADISETMSSGVYDYAEQKYHVSNEIAVQINNIVESSKLEVLTATDTEFITNETDEKGNITSWLQVDGEAVFTVDLSAAEYIYDADRNTITVVVPYPEVTSCRLTRGENLLFENNSFIRNGSYKEGQNLALRQFHAGYLKLLNYFSTNSKLRESARNSSELLIKNLVLQLYDDKNINIKVNFKGIDEKIEN